MSSKLQIPIEIKIGDRLSGISSFSWDVDFEPTVGSLNTVSVKLNPSDVLAKYLSSGEKPSISQFLRLLADIFEEDGK